ncbi:MAG: BamA/TamA family outer membrane protein [Chitinophaga sp.]|uniref:BamA/TamA family outer membrane protein n=1 Tax=Chitinophaga sp. TaxID=1869181 RepID=UPI001B0D1D8B|nr:BamA/TamA family outer membrane protein [Chitinophaga sp.]MBO9728812.1 BamA/TamA family outer membrane protein [Chitinophaga sp.]
MNRYRLLFLLIVAPAVLNAQLKEKADSTATVSVPRGFFDNIMYYLKHTNVEKKKKKVDLSFIGGPVYTPETSVGIAVMMAAQYKTDRSDSLLPVSNAAIYASVAATGFYGIGISNTTIFPHDRFRLALKASFSSRPNKYWGIGYDAGEHKDNYSEFVQLTEKMQADFSVNLNGKLFAGLCAQIHNVQTKKLDTTGGKPFMLPEKILGIGAGPFIVYDTRDFIPNAYKGVYVRLGYRFFPSIFGNKAVFSQFDLQFDWYKKLWKGAVLATDLYGEERSGDVPWSLLAEAGGSNRLRGYYEGRFRDKNYVAAQIELRQRIYNRSGLVAWVGGGNVFPQFNAFEFRQSLISYGIGYRWEFKKRVNIRLDYGRGKDQSGFYFGINEVF